MKDASLTHKAKGLTFYLPGVYVAERSNYFCITETVKKLVMIKEK